MYFKLYCNIFSREYVDSATSHGFPLYLVLNYQFRGKIGTRTAGEVFCSNISFYHSVIQHLMLQNSVHARTFLSLFCLTSLEVEKRLNRILHLHSTGYKDNLTVSPQIVRKYVFCLIFWQVYLHHVD